MQDLRLPRAVERDPRGQHLLRTLSAQSRPLWPEGRIEVPLVRSGPDLAAALAGARSAGRVVRGLEDAEQRLAAEERGLRLADRRSGVPRELHPYYGT